MSRVRAGPGKNTNSVMERKTMELKDFKDWALSFKAKVEALLLTRDLEALKKDLDALEKRTYDANFWDDKEAAQAIIKELTDLKESYAESESLRQAKEALDTAIELAEMDEAIDFENEVAHAEKLYTTYETKLLLSGKYDKSNAIMEIHPGAGGTESQDWALMLLRMYERFSQKESFTMEINDYLEASEAGLKRVTLTVSGPYAYGLLKAESGVHRLVRISPFDSGARRHTSFASVNVIPELDDAEMEDIPSEDIKIDTYRSSGAGGQSVNTTDSAVRMTHVPTGVVVTCQNERSQIKNRAKAMKILQGKLFQLKVQEHKETIAALKNVTHPNAFGSQIRSYVMHPYSMVKDHRTNEETSQVNKVLDGELNDFMYAYLKKEAG